MNRSSSRILELSLTDTAFDSLAFSVMLLIELPDFVSLGQVNRIVEDILVLELLLNVT